MQMSESIRTKEQLEALLKKAGQGYDGEFNASIGGKNFVSATGDNTTFYEAADDFLIVGFDDEKRGHVAFTVKKRLVGDGPHKVEWYRGKISWSADVDGDFQLIESGWAEVTFLKKVYERIGAKGDIHFQLPDGREIEGDFDIKIV
jgi:hypothetical protein